MEGVEKCELPAPSPATEKNSPENPSPDQPNKTRLGGGKRFSLGRFGRLRNRKVYLGLLIVFVLLIVLIVVPGIFALISAKRTYTQVKVTLASLKQQDIEGA